jgi:hypothetical protein
VTRINRTDAPAPTRPGGSHTARPVRLLPVVLVALVVPAAVLYGCGGSTASSSAPDAATEAAATVLPEASAPASEAGVDAPPDGDGYVNKAPHCVRTDAGVADPYDAGVIPDVISPAQVLNYGGTTLHHPTFVSVTFPDDEYKDQLADFIASVGCTDYWSTITADYGVGEGVAAEPVVLTEAAPTTTDDATIRAWVAAKVEAGTFPRPDPDIVYALWYPETTTITLETGDAGQTAVSCQAFGGYHEGGKLSDGTPFSYAVLPRCQTQGGSVVDGLTGVASHELIEACTDPQPDTAPAYAAPDANHLGWILADASEVGDLCEFGQSSIFQPTGFPWMVQRIYSNSAAWAGKDPCVPASGADYFYGVPAVPDVVMLDMLQTGTPIPTAVAHIAVGSSETFPVKLVGPADVTSMSVEADDIATFFGGTPTLTLQLSASTGAPGDTLQLTITKNSASPDDMGFGGAVTGFVVSATVGTTQSGSIALTSD